MSRAFFLSYNDICYYCKAEEARDQYQICVADAGVRRMDLANAKSTILTQIREMVFQCDLTLKAVSKKNTVFNTFVPKK